MELTFNKVDNIYVVEFKAEDDFNLHIERAKTGTIRLYQRGSDVGEYKLIAKQGNNTDDTVIDSNVVGVICPMYFKIESYVEPTLAVVTSKGNVELVENTEE